MKKKINCILFDLDGTLIESGPDLLDSLNYVLIKNRIPEIPKDIIGNLVGGGAANMILKAYNYYKLDIEKEKLEILVNEFLDFYSFNCSKKTLPYENVSTTLDALFLKKIIMCVCTNKKQYLAEKILADLHLNKYFEIILGSNPRLRLKPDCEMLKFLIRKIGVNTDNILMVGDSENDIIPSNLLGIKSVFVNYGYGKIYNSKPSFTIQNFNQILDLI